MRGVQGMVENDRYCIDVLTQISAIQAALDKVALGLLAITRIIAWSGARREARVRSAPRR